MHGLVLDEQESVFDPAPCSSDLVVGYVNHVFTDPKDPVPGCACIWTISRSQTKAWVVNLRAQSGYECAKWSASFTEVTGRAMTSMVEYLCEKAEEARQEV